MFVANQFKAQKSIVSHIKESLVCESYGYTDKIIFANHIMEYRVQNKGERRLCNTCKYWKNSVLFDILNDISEYVTVVQLLYKVGNVGHFVSIPRNWIFNSNSKKTSVDKRIIGYYFFSFQWWWNSCLLQRVLLCSSLYQPKSKTQSFCMVLYLLYFHIKWNVHGYRDTTRR